MRLFFLLILITTISSLAMAKPKTDKELTQTASELERIRKELQEQKRVFELIRQSENTVLDKIQQTEQNLKRNQTSLLAIQSTSEQIHLKVQDSKNKLDSLEKQVVAQKKALALKVRHLYQQGQQNKAMILSQILSKKSAQNQIIQSIYWNKLLNQDRKELDQLKNTLISYQENLGIYNSRLSSLKNVLEFKSKEQLAFDLEKKEQEEKLSSIKTDKAKKEKALQEYEDQQNQMQDLLKMLQKRKEKEDELREKALKVKQALKERKAQKNTANKDSKDRTLENASRDESPTNSESNDDKSYGSGDKTKCWPVKGPLEDTYGRFFNKELEIWSSNNFITIKAPLGTGVKSASEGKVVHISSDFFRRGNGIVILNSKGQAFSYAHLNSVKVSLGQTVKACQMIGSVGSVGSFTGPKLYFQISEQNPSKWLQDAL